MSSIEDAILRTILYADVFSFPLTVPELHHFLIAPMPISRAQIESALRTSPWLATALHEVDGYWVCAGRGDLVAVRQQRERAAASLLPAALYWGRWMARLPFVRMVAITGALAVRNCADDRDDLDYLLVTAAGRVWLTRLLAVVIVRVARLRGVILCPNYVVAETALTQQRRDLFVAHEIAQMLPVYGRAVYDAMRQHNGWVSGFMANADDPLYATGEYTMGGGWREIKRLAETMLAGKPGDALEAWEHRRKLRRFAAQMSTPHSDARLDAQHVKGHFRDHGHPVLTQYADRLRRHRLDEADDAQPYNLPLAGD